MAKVKGYGCSSVIHALCLQYSLAGLGLRCSIQRTTSGQWVVGAELRDYTRAVPKPQGPVVLEEARTVTTPKAYWEDNYGMGPVGVCDCAQGRFPCTCQPKAIASSIAIHGGI